MPKAKRKPAKRPQDTAPGLAPTEAQLAHGSYERTFVPNPSGAGELAQVHVNRGFEQNGRLFKVRHLDRLHKAGKLSETQYAAGVWYRDQHDRCRYDRVRIMDPNRIVAGVVMGSADWQEMARDRFRTARAALPREMIGFVDRLVLHNRWPKMHQRERFRTIERLGAALDDLAIHIQHPRR
jgi:hypothetical protein